MPGGFTVTLVESPNTPIIGVGEGTWPTLRTTLAKIGVSETDFFRECDAAFKQGARFARWTTGEADDAYYHPLMLPQSFAQLNLAPHWLADDSGQQLLRHGEPARAGSATTASRPRRSRRPNTRRSPITPIISTPANSRRSSSAIAATKLGVRHVLADVQKRASWPKTATSAASSPNRRARSKAICSSIAPASRRCCIGEALGVPFKDCSDVLFCDTALAVQVPL